MISVDTKANSINIAYRNLCSAIIVDAIDKGDYQFFMSKWGAELVSLCEDVLDYELDLDDLTDKAMKNNKKLQEEDIFSMVM